ncbi:MAG TPA: hypothetical protein VMZ11_07680 [Mycobacteriales bacterium]|nr:hypothetical protein [Mycobacteriales bacterium]
MTSWGFDDQHQVATRQQLLQSGLTHGALVAQVVARRWRRLTPTVYVLHNGPLTQVQSWWAATLAVGPLAGRTALQAWGLKGWESPHVEVLVPRGSRPPLPVAVDLLVHESRRFGEDDVHPAREPRRVHVSRAAVDAAAWTRDPRAACGLLAAVVQQRKSTAAQLSAELGRAGQVRHAPLLRAVLSDIGGGADALSEIDLARLCTRFGLRVADRQVVRRGPGGRRRYVDARVEAPNGRFVLVEVDGALHLLVSSYWRDMERLNEIVIGGDRVLRFSSTAVRLDPEAVGNQLRRACGLPPLAPVGLHAA